MEEMVAPGCGSVADGQKVMPRETPEVEPSRAALVKQWCARVRAAKRFHEPAFKRIREDMIYARLGASRDWVDADNYVVPLINRHINLDVAALYARNPRAYCKVKDRLESTVWDGDPQSLAMAIANPLSPMSLAVIADAEQVRQRRSMLKRMGKTLEILFNHFLDEQEPSFKTQFKQLVRRTKVCGVGYVKLGFQRLLEARPEITAQIADAASELARLETLAADAIDGEFGREDARAEELRLLMADLQTRAEVIVREGPIFDFPRATEIIVDPRCRQLKGFIGADWIAHEMLLTPDEVKDIYKIDVRSGFTPYEGDGDRYCLITDEGSPKDKKPSLVCVWEVQHKRNGEVFTIADGWPDFLREPAEPDVRIERFWTVFALTFNDVEDEREIYPFSDTRLIIHPQQEYNRAREGLRQHRQANRPAYGVQKGLLSEEDKNKLETRPAHAVLELNALADGRKVEDVLQPLKPAPIDPALYDTEMVFADILRAVGSQEANLGGLSGATATESSIAEQSRTMSSSSNIDDLDDLLGELARATGQLMLMELDGETVRRIAGPGAVWPEVSRDEVVRDLRLDVKAGSSGRPNKAAELANRERAMPYLVQFPGLNPEPLLRDYLDLLGIDVTEAVVAGMPSIVAQNATMGKQVQAGTGDPADDPAAQGGAGADNAPAAPMDEQGGQPAYPAGPLDTM